MSLPRACYAVLRTLVPSERECRLSYMDLVGRLPERFHYLDMGNQQHRNELSEALGQIVVACRNSHPPLPPLPAIVVHRDRERLGYPGEGYFSAAYPDIHDEMRQLVLWGRDLEAVQRTQYPQELFVAE